MRYETSFKDLHDEMWRGLSSIEGEVGYISALAPDSVFQKWVGKKQIRPDESFDELCQSIGERCDHLRICRELWMKQDVPTLNVYHSQEHYPMLIMEFFICAIRFKSGVTLKTDDEISLYCFDNYKTTDRDDHAKLRRRYVRHYLLPPRSV